MPPPQWKHCAYYTEGIRICHHQFLVAFNGCIGQNLQGNESGGDSLYILLGHRCKTKAKTETLSWFRAFKKWPYGGQYIVYMLAQSQVLWANGYLIG